MMKNSAKFRVLAFVLVGLRSICGAFASQGDIDFIGQNAYCLPDATGKYLIQNAILEDKVAQPGVSAQGGGCVARSLSEAWLAFQHPLNLTWHKTKADGFEVIKPLPADAAFGLIIKSKVDKYAPIHIARWKSEWIHSITKGSEAHPLQITIRYRKTEGESNVRFWSGIIELNEIAPNLSSFSVRDQIDATQAGIRESEDAVRSLLEVARSAK